jgi:hypothetical protein
VASRRRSAASLVAIAVLATLISACTGTALTRAAEPRASYSTTVAERSDAVKATVVALFADKARLRDTPFAAFAAHPVGDQVFPEDFQLEHASGGAQDVNAYVAIPRAERADDLYLFDPIGTFWKSEYEANGAPVPFHCNFVVHLANRGTSHTEIFAIEHAPTVNAGRRFFLLGHEGPGFYDDLRIVQPTNRDREALLRLLETHVKTAIGKQEQAK